MKVRDHIRATYWFLIYQKPSRTNEQSSYRHTTLSPSRSFFFQRTMPFPLPSIKHAQASPSLSLEKGSYRLRAPPTRPRSKSRILPSASDPSVATSAARGDPFVPASYEKRMALLVALLACAMLASFGTAYYLWSTRRVAYSIRSRFEILSRVVPPVVLPPTDLGDVECCLSLCYLPVLAYRVLPPGEYCYSVSRPCCFVYISTSSYAYLLYRARRKHGRVVFPPIPTSCRVEQSDDVGASPQYLP